MSSLKISKKIYFGENARQQNKELLKKVRRRKWDFGIYVITLSETEGNLLDVYETIFFTQKQYGKMRLNIVGVALSREEAFLLVREIVDDVYKKTGGFDVKGYFLGD